MMSIDQDQASNNDGSSSLQDGKVDSITAADPSQDSEAIRLAANKSDIAKQGTSNDNESQTSIQDSTAEEENITSVEASGESDNANGDSNGTKRQLDSPLNGQNAPKRAKPGDSPDLPVVESNAFSDTTDDKNSTILQPEANASTTAEQMDVEESKPTPPTNGDTPAVASTSEEEVKPLPPSSTTEQPVAMDVEETKSNSSHEDGANVIENNTNYDDTNIDYSDLIDPALADVMRLEDMVIPKVDPLESLTFRDLAQLEAALQIGDHYNYGEDDGWKGDWAGNLDLFRKEVVVNKNYLNTQPSGKPIRIDYCDWVASNARDHNDLRGLELLFRYVYHMKGTPAMAKKILAYALQRPAKSSEERLDFIIKAANRMNYDPIVLQQDGWTIKKADSPEGPLGGAIYIGKRVMWQKHEAVVVGYIPDETYGGLWKGVFLEDLDTFDMEPGELQRGLKKWENKQRQKTARSNAATGSTRFAATAKFSVPGIENGIILAKPNNRAAKGLLWPARVRNVVEGKLTAEGKVVSDDVLVKFYMPCVPCRKRLCSQPFFIPSTNNSDVTRQRTRSMSSFWLPFGMRRRSLLRRWLMRQIHIPLVCIMLYQVLTLLLSSRFVVLTCHHSLFKLNH